jgi:hypothetical protein
MNSLSGMMSKPGYGVWIAMRTRCLNPNSDDYPDYGGRGISICERWSSFDDFMADMGPRPSSRHSIDRIDNDGNYEPTNCRWATPTEQANNRRSSHLVTFNGETMTVANWARRLGLSHDVLQARFDNGWPPERALTQRLRPSTRMITFNGETKMLSEWAKGIGIKPHTLIARLKADWPLERALVVAQQNTRMLTHGGDTLPIGEWAKRLDVSITTLISRIDYYKWSIERALSTPPADTNTRRKRLLRSER